MALDDEVRLANIGSSESLASHMSRRQANRLDDLAKRLETTADVLNTTMLDEAIAEIRQIARNLS